VPAGVRDVNRSLPAADRIRVIAADSPIDWSQVRDGHAYEKAFGGAKFFASVIEREVLAENRKAPGDYGLACRGSMDDVQANSILGDP
jgi:hypothetical protein